MYIDLSDSKIKNIILKDRITCNSSPYLQMTLEGGAVLTIHFENYQKAELLRDLSEDLCEIFEGI